MTVMIKVAEVLLLNRGLGGRVVVSLVCGPTPPSRTSSVPGITMTVAALAHPVATVWLGGSTPECPVTAPERGNQYVSGPVRRTSVSSALTGKCQRVRGLSRCATRSLLLANGATARFPLLYLNGRVTTDDARPAAGGCRTAVCLSIAVTGCTMAL
jgi:hypothetical protein